MIKAIIFDLDDTLFPEQEFVFSGLQAVGNWLIQEHSIMGFESLAKQLFQQEKRGNIFNLVLERLGIQVEDSFIQILVKVYREHQPQLQLYHDANWAINYFNPDKKLGLITDGYLITQQNKVKALNLETDFDAIVYSDEYGRENWKPSSVPYQKMMELLQCEGSECVYIADNPLKDFVTAKSLNWMTIRICRPRGEYSQLTTDQSYEADWKISALFELQTLFERLKP